MPFHTLIIHDMIGDMQYTLPILSLILFSLTLPLFNLGFIAWFALVPLMLFLVREVSSKKALLVGGLFFFLYILFVIWPLTSVNVWWWVSTNPLIFQYRELIIILVILIIAFYAGGIFGILFAWGLRRKQNPFLVALLWSLLELLRLPTVAGFNWGILGYSQNEYLPILQITKLIGVVGLSFVIVFVNTLIFKSIQAKKISYFVYAALVVLIIFVFGSFQIREISGNTQVSVLHLDTSTEDIYSTEKTSEILSLVEKEFEKDPKIIVLPENIFPTVILDQNFRPTAYQRSELIRNIYDSLLGYSEKHPETILLLGLHQQTVVLYNSVIAIENGYVVGAYHKQRLMPFGEQGLPFITQNQLFSFAGGRENTILIDNLEIQPLICSEIAVPFQETDANLIINISNDSIFDSSLVGKQNLIIAKVMAVQHQKYILRSVKKGVSAIISPFGQILEQQDSKTSFLSTEINLE